MRGVLRIVIISIFSLFGTTVFSQKKGEIIVKGTVYMNASRSQGIANGKTFEDPQRTFPNQNIYFKKDSITVKTKTDSKGSYTLTLKPGAYEVFQEAGLNAPKDGMTHIGTYWIQVQKDVGSNDIFFENHINGRSVAPGAMTGGKPTKSQKIIGPKNQ